MSVSALALFTLWCLFLVMSGIEFAVMSDGVYPFFPVLQAKDGASYVGLSLPTRLAPIAVMGNFVSGFSS